jgi:hypothetical protein
MRRLVKRLVQSLVPDGTNIPRAGDFAMDERNERNETLKLGQEADARK